MARPHKEGLDYFSFDCDFFDNRKVRKILRAGGANSALILTCLLCNIYKGKGYYISVDDDLPFDIADCIGVSEGSVNETILKAVQVDFFSEYQFRENKVLTSPEILRRYKAGSSQRDNVVFDERFTVFKTYNPVSTDDNSINTSDNTQSKVKETKGKESKRKSFVVASATPTASESDYKELVENLDGKELKVIWSGLKDFIDTHKPNFIEPYFDAWNLFAGFYKLSKAETINDDRKKKFRTRIAEPGFDFIKVLEKIKLSDLLLGNAGKWKVSFDWIFENQSNYIKIIEGNYDN